MKQISPRYQNVDKSELKNVIEDQEYWVFYFDRTIRNDTLLKGQHRLPKQQSYVIKRLHKNN